MVLLDMLGRRMTLRILWELSLAGAPLTFRALQQASETNPSVLNTRLKELRELGFVGHGEGGYGLTEAGADAADAANVTDGATGATAAGAGVADG